MLKLQKEIDNRKYDSEYIKLKTLSEMKLFPDEGECFTYRGGKGNKILKEVKKENGIIYERYNTDEYWVEIDIWKYYLRLKKMLGIDKILESK
jgi:hypothetical protein